MWINKHVQFPTSSIQVGQKYWKLTITRIYSIPRANTSSTRSYVEYRCDCWKVWTCQKDCISRWKTNCWCERTYKVKHWFTKNRDCNNPQWRFYVIYSWMNERCSNSNQTGYHRYWWRWIKCLWNSFEEFKDDMREDYQNHVDEFWLNNTTLDRIDVNWNYCKENCRRLTNKEQGFTKEWTRHIELDWKVYTSQDIANIAWISLMCAVWRIDWYLGWTISKEEIFSLKNLNPSRNKVARIIIEWKEYTTIDIRSMCWIDRFEAYRRIKFFKQWKITKEQLFYKWKLNLRWKQSN